MLPLDPLYVYNNAFDRAFDNRPSSLVRDNTVTEKVWTGYGKLTIDGVVGGKNLKGAIGGQVIHSEQRSDGQIASVLDGVVTIAPADQSRKSTRLNSSH